MNNDGLHFPFPHTGTDNSEHISCLIIDGTLGDLGKVLGVKLSQFDRELYQSLSGVRARNVIVFRNIRTD